ncbi:MAG: Fe-S cluster assembly protein SufD [Methylococcaceae bacterium]
MSGYRELCSRLSERLPFLPGHGIKWMAERRNNAMTTHFERDFNTPQSDEWGLSTTIGRRLERSEHVEISAEWLDRYRVPGALCLVFVDGVFRPEYSTCEPVPADVTLKTLQQLDAEQMTTVSLWMSTHPPAEHHPMLNWNTIWMQDGVRLVVPAHTRLDAPVQILCFGATSGVLIPLRHFICLGLCDEATLIETHVGLEGCASVTSVHSELDLDDNASLHHYSLQVESPLARSFLSLNCINGRHARFHQHHLALGGAKACAEVQVQALRGSECELNGVFYVDGSRHTEIRTRVEHTEPSSHSGQNYRGMASDKAKGVFDGIIKVAAHAQKITANMQNRNLLLSPNAVIDSRPQLEISADDVRCSHGVTVGQLDADAVFFLMARGLTETEARTMLSFAFAYEIIEKIPQGDYRQIARDALINALPPSDLHQEWL